MLTLQRVLHMQVLSVFFVPLITVHKGRPWRVCTACGWDSRQGNVLDRQCINGSLTQQQGSLLHTHTLYRGTCVGVFNGLHLSSLPHVLLLQRRELGMVSSTECLMRITHHQQQLQGQIQG